MLLVNFRLSYHLKRAIILVRRLEQEIDVPRTRTFLHQFAARRYDCGSLALTILLNTKHRKEYRMLAS